MHFRLWNSNRTETWDLQELASQTRTPFIHKQMTRQSCWRRKRAGYTSEAINLAMPFGIKRALHNVNNQWSNTMQARRQRYRCKAVVTSTAFTAVRWTMPAHWAQYMWIMKIMKRLTLKKSRTDLRSLFVLKYTRSVCGPRWIQKFWSSKFKQKERPFLLNGLPVDHC